MCLNASRAYAVNMTGLGDCLAASAALVNLGDGYIGVGDVAKFTSKLTRCFSTLCQGMDAAACAGAVKAASKNSPLAQNLIKALLGSTNVTDTLRPGMANSYIAQVFQSLRQPVAPPPVTAPVGVGGGISAGGMAVGVGIGVVAGVALYANLRPDDIAQWFVSDIELASACNQSTINNTCISAFSDNNPTQGKCDSCFNALNRCYSEMQRKGRITATQALSVMAATEPATCKCGRKNAWDFSTCLNVPSATVVPVPSGGAMIP